VALEHMDETLKRGENNSPKIGLFVCNCNQNLNASKLICLNEELCVIED
jgi:hypothetical protein